MSELTAANTASPPCAALRRQSHINSNASTTPTLHDHSLSPSAPRPPCGAFGRMDRPPPAGSTSASAGSASTSPSASLAAVRGRPRSSSISSGSPSPAPGTSIPLPSLFGEPPQAPANSWSFRTSTATSALTSSLASGFSTGAPTASGSGWGHRPSLSVPGIVAPQAVAPSGAGRIQRHRRTQSVSPPGFPLLSEGDASGFATSARSSGSAMSAARPSAPLPLPPPSDSASHQHPHQHQTPAKGTSAIPIGGPTRAHLHQSARTSSPSRSNSATNSPQSNSSSSASSSAASSPIASTSPTHVHSAAHAHHHPSSHAALLSGIRSHALPHSPILDGIFDPTADPHFPPSITHARRLSGGFGRPHSPVLSSSPQSPPFGPTTANLPPHPPSPLGLDHHRGSPDLAFEAIINRRRGSADEIIGFPQFVDPFGGGMTSAPVGIPGSGGRAMSPPLLPLSLTPPEGGGTGLGLNSAMGRARSSSIGRASGSGMSPASVFAEKEVAHSLSPRSPTDGEQVVTSPPLSPPLFPRSASGLFGVSPTLTTVALPFSPTSTSAALSLHSPPPLAPLELSAAPPPAPTPAEVPSDSATLSEILPPTDHKFVPPPSPHRGTISLPPPVVAPAPLPHHLGGPALHSDKAGKPRPSKARKALVAATLASPGTEHAPKRHSPLASPALSSSEDDSPPLEQQQDEEEDEEAMDAEEEQQVDKASVERQLDDAAETQLEGTQTTLHSAITPADDLDEGFGSSSPPRQSPEIRAAISQGPDGMMSYFSDADTRAATDAHNARTVPVEQSQAGTASFGALGFMEVDPPVPSALGLDTLGGEAQAEVHESRQDSSEEENDVIAIDEENLSALERIFICAKSETFLERARVAHHLADWLQAVDMAESVEYVLPLLAGLATDPEEVVKEVFAPQLDRIMWHFFAQCPLTELDAPSDGPAVHSDTSPSGSPVPSRYQQLATATTTAAFASEQSSEPSPTWTSFDDSSADTAPSTTKTSATNSEVSDAPHLSASSFTSLLGALLTDQSALVAKQTEAALVRFLCTLKRKPVPELLPEISDDLLRELGEADLEKLLAQAGPRKETGYKLTEEASHVLEDEFVTGIVLGLARLDEDERQEQQERSMELDERSHSRVRPPLSPEEASVTLVLSPEEEQIEDGWMSQDSGRDAGLEGWATDPIIPFEEDTPVETPEIEVGAEIEDDLSASQDIGFGEPVSAVPSPRGANNEYSSFSPDVGAGDEESAIGKMVSMSLIAAIAEANCLDEEVLTEQILPEVERMKDESMFYVRKEAVQALASLAKALPVTVLEEKLIPLHAEFAQDALWHVRRAACLALPDICRRLPEPLLRETIVASVATFSGDQSRNVRSGALEVCGELVYLFHENVEGVPQELVNFFLGQEAAPAQKEEKRAEDDDVFAPLQSALDSPPSSFYDNVPGWGPNGPTTKDPDRPVMCAFNFPACVLTLGRDQWPVLRHYYLSLCRERADKVRQSLASSLHEIAKIIGTEHADECLLDPFKNFIVDLDHIQGAALENVDVLLRQFGQRSAREALSALRDAWGEIKSWRRREALCRSLGSLAEHFAPTETFEMVLFVLGRAWRDPVAAVREQVAAVYPTLLKATQGEGKEEARSQVLAVVDTFSHDSAYRNRLTLTAALIAVAEEEACVNRALFDDRFLEPLARLACDKVVSVRIGVAHVMNVACKKDSLYAQSENRDERVKELLNSLAASPDKDVAQLVAEFVPRPPTVEVEEEEIDLNEERGRSGGDREGARSRMACHDEDEEDSMALTPSNSSHNLEEDARMGDTTDPPPYSAQDPIASSSTGVQLSSMFEAPSSEDEEEDVEMADSDEPVLLEKPSPAGGSSMELHGEGEGNNSSSDEEESGRRGDWRSEELEGGFVSVSRC